MKGEPRVAAVPESTFWRFQVIGWSAYCLLTVVSRLDHSALGPTVAWRIVYAVAGLSVSVILRAFLGRALARAWPMTALATSCAMVSYLLALLWAGSTNLLRQAIDGHITSAATFSKLLVPTFIGTLNYTFILLAWGFLYIGAQQYGAAHRERERALRAEALASEAKLRALQNQLNPHLFFNALNTVSALIADNRTTDATLLIAKLGAFMRTTLRQDIVSRLPLADELSATRQYLDIELVRFGDRLRVEYDVSARAYRAHLPSLILQPLVENAIHHGIAKRPGPGIILIRAFVRDQVLAVSVENYEGSDLPRTNRVFLPNADDTTEPGSPSGVGLRNVRARLEALYGTAGTLTAAAIVNGGFRAELTIPFASAVRGAGDPAAPGVAVA